EGLVWTADVQSPPVSFEFALGVWAQIKCNGAVCWKKSVNSCNADKTQADGRFSPIGRHAVTSAKRPSALVLGVDAMLSPFHCVTAPAPSGPSTIQPTSIQALPHGPLKWPLVSNRRGSK
ncbi:hypothetical protein THAOC_22151, partial [Thalassiosira oceanica]